MGNLGKTLKICEKLILFFALGPMGLFILIIDHFTVVCLVAWPWNENSHQLAWEQHHSHEKSREVSIKTRSTAASLSFKSWVTKHTTLKINGLLSWFMLGGWNSLLHVSRNHSRTEVSENLSSIILIIFVWQKD